MRWPRPLLFASLVRGLFVVAALGHVGVARAQAAAVKPAPPDSAAPGNPPPPPAAPVTPPALKKDEGAAYPQQALDEGVHDAVQVALVLTIDANGAVTKATVETPVGHGFDEAAVAAAQKLQFDPAMRDGKPVAARIRFLYAFRPPPGVLAGRVVTLSGDHAIAGAAIVVRDASGHEFTATTAADGAWRIDQLPAGTYHLTVTVNGMVPHEADETVTPGQETSALDRLDVVPVAPPIPTGSAGDAGPPAAEEPIQEVEVHGEKPPREVTKRTLTRDEINRIPGTNGDALRSLQNLPGVARAPGLAGLLVVRGSAPADSQYFIDGTPIPIVYHFGGLSSVIPTEMLDKIDFYPGNFSAQYGRAMGGIVDVGLVDPSKDKLHAMAEVDLIDARVLAQGPLFDTGWRFAVGARRSWVDVWLGPVLEATGAGVTVAPVYYDYQAILERDLGKHSSIRFGFFGDEDRIAILIKNPAASDPVIAGNLSSTMGFWRGQVQYRNRFTDDTELRIVAATGEDYVDFTLGDIFFKVTSYPISSRIELAQKLERRLTMNIGMDMLYSPYTVDVRAPPTPIAGQPPPGPFAAQMPLESRTSSSIYEPALYVEWEATPWQGGRIVPGIRLDYTKDTKSWDLDPRIVVRQDVTSSPRTTLKAGVGVFSEPPQPQQTNAVFGTPGLVDNRAYHYDVGVEREFTSHIEASLEGFYKQLDHLYAQGYGSTGSGVIYGAETLIRYKPDEHFFGWLAYTLSRSLRRDAPGLPLRLTQFDETHVLTAIGSYKLGHGWQFGARYRLTSGYMSTPSMYGFYDENIGTNLALLAYPPNGTRLPLFHSLDLRIDKEWKRPWGSFSMYLDVLNVYNNGNVDGVTYDYNFTHTTNTNDLPILPSLGLRVDL